MKGTVTKWSDFNSSGFITGEDGNDYFLHKSEMVNSKNVKRGNIVSFDYIDEGKTCLRAVNVKKTGHGPSHPFVHDLERIYDALDEYVSEFDSEKDYILRDVRMIMNYFKKAEDIEWCPNVRETFRYSQR